MRLVATFLLLCLALPVLAQDDAALFQINDVVADVTAANAAAARDKAVMQAQRSALEQLMGRLGAEATLATKQSDDALAGLVQGFEVQQERTSSVRYIGTFTVQFKPAAVRALLGQGGHEVTVTRGKPTLILPVVQSGTRVILWEDNTAWRKAWESAASGGGLIPLVVPMGDMTDIATINGQEAISGKPEAWQAIMGKYQAVDAALAILQEPAAATDPVRVSLQRWQTEGSLAAPVVVSVNNSATAAAEGVRQLKLELDQQWREASKPPAMGPVSRLPIAVPTPNLAVWSGVQARLAAIPAIKRTNIIALSRGGANIELEYQGSLPDLQQALLAQNLILTSAAGGWLLQTR
jgi:hypothetical protein